MQDEIEEFIVDLKKKHENEIGHLKIEHDIELCEKLEDLQRKNDENLKKEHEKEIELLKKEVLELKENLHAKTDATNKTNDHKINPIDYQFNHECMVKEEVKS